MAYGHNASSYSGGFKSQQLLTGPLTSGPPSKSGAHLRRGTLYQQAVHWKAVRRFNGPVPGNMLIHR